MRPAASPGTAKSETPLAGARGHDDEVGHVAVEDEHLVAVEHPAVALLRGLALDAAEVPLAVVLGDGEGGDRLARGDAGQVALLGLVVARRQQRVGGQRDGGEERRAEQRGTHLLEDDEQLHVGEARPPELLGDGQRLQAELVGHLAPHGGVVALGGVHEAADLGLGRLLRQEAADRSAQLLLLVTEGEIHARAPRACFSPGSPAGGASLGPAGCLPDRGRRDQKARRVSRWDHGTAGENLERRGGRGPPDRGRPDGQQRVHPALPPDRATPC